MKTTCESLWKAKKTAEELLSIISVMAYQAEVFEAKRTVETREKWASYFDVLKNLSSANGKELMDTESRKVESLLRELRRELLGVA